MPGFDRTGPRGIGPLTGGGRGWCNPSSSLHTGYGTYGPPSPLPFRPDEGYPPLYGFGRPRWGLRLGFGGRGLGRGRRRGWGRGRGRGWW